MVTGRRNPNTAIDFGNPIGMWVHPDFDEVRFDVRRAREIIRCRVTFEFVEDRYGSGKHLHLAKRHFDQITDEVSRLIGAGIREPDGSVLLKG
ncbi:MAG: hypothetical protein ACREGL_03025, partial [Alphaproteobacteria bacterium]